MRGMRLAGGTAAVASAAMIWGGLAGVGTSAFASGSLASRHFTLTRSYDYFTGANAVVRWSPCRKTPSGVVAHVIHYKINPAGVHSRITFVKTGIARLSKATGLHFHYDGTTHYIPHSVKTSYGTPLAAKNQLAKTGVRFVIAWAYQGTGHGTSNLLVPGLEAGVGSISWQSSTQSPLRITDAAVVLKRGRVLLSPGFGAGGTKGTLLLHELGHAVGLQHYIDTAQVMNPTIGLLSPGNYAAGDRTGLTKVGRKAGCMPGKDPPPSV